MEQADYFNLSVPETCEGGIQRDAVTVTTSLERYGRIHRVAHYHGNSCAPPVLDTIERRIDEVAGTGEWVMCPPDVLCPSG
jgi:hypothetical protein